MIYFIFFTIKIDKILFKSVAKYLAHDKRKVKQMPNELITLLYDFADIHGISRDEALSRWRRGKISGRKFGAGRQAVIVIDARGKRDFFAQFNQEPGFRACGQCPHS